MIYKNAVILGVLSVFLLTCSITYPQNCKEKTHDCFNTWFEAANVSNANSDISELTFEEINILYSVIEKHVTDTLFEARWLGLNLVSRVVSVNRNEKVGNSSVSLLMKFLFDSDTRIQYSASESLISIPSFYFTESQIDSILISLKSSSNPVSTSNLIKLCGKLEITESLSLLEEISENSKNPFIKRWIALAALTRMGDEKSEQKMLDFIKRTGISLDAINMLYPYVTYSRSRKNVDYLMSIIKNDNSECESTNPDVTTRIPCAYHLLKVVGPTIKGFNWEGPNGLEMLKPSDALEKSRKYLTSIKDNWEFVGE